MAADPTPDGRFAEPDPDALLGALSHEIGNLLAAIRLSAHLMGGEGDGSAREVEALAGRAGALLAHVRPLLGQSAGERLRMPAQELLEGIAHALEDDTPDAARLSVTKPPAGLPAARVDPEAVHRVLVSLSLGALEASRPDGSLRVSARGEDDHLVVVLTQRGRPLDFEELARPAPRSSQELGLRLADAVLRLGGGHLRVADEATGPRVEAWLPAAER